VFVDFWENYSQSTHPSPVPPPPPAAIFSSSSLIASVFALIFASLSSVSILCSAAYCASSPKVSYSSGAFPTTFVISSETTSVTLPSI
jgi:hypothetical protein